MFRMLRKSAALAALFVLAGCTLPAMPRFGQGKPDATLYGMTRGNFLTRFSAAAPTRLEFERRVRGLADGEEIVGLDVRPADGRLYALASTGRLYTIDPASATATRVGAADAGAQMQGVEYGMSFEPAGDRIRVVGNAGENLRIDARTGATIDGDLTRPGVQGDQSLRYAPGDRNAERRPAVTAVAFARGPGGAMTAYVIDRVTSALAMLGGAGGDAASGRLTTVGPLGITIGGPVQLDVDRASNIAYLATVPMGGLATLYTVDLATGAATRLGYIGDASFPMRALAVDRQR